MKVLLLLCAVAVILGSSEVYAYLPAPTSPYTITFDDIPYGQDLSYYDEQYGLRLVVNWQVVDHTGSSWGPPSSSPNVAVWDSSLNYVAGLRFGSDPNDYPETKFLPYTVRSVSGYVSTEVGIIIRMTGYSRGGVPLVSAVVGATGEPRTNQYVEILSESGNIAFVDFEGVNSPEEKRHFCIDDLTITPIPEPTSLAALALALAGTGGAFVRRRRA